MNTLKIEKTSADSARRGIGNSLDNHSHDNSKQLSVYDYAKNPPISQCLLCGSPVQSESTFSRLCAHCEAQNQRFAENLFEHIKQNRKVIRLHRCFCCNGCFALSKFSVYLGICKKCFANRNAGEPARLTFAKQAARNVQKILGGAIL